MTPDGWHQHVLNDIAEIVGGGTPARENPRFWGGNVPWATPTDVTALRSRTIRTTATMITQHGLDASSAKLLPAGTVLLTSRATIGACAVAEVAMATNQGFQSLVPRSAVTSAFLLYLAQWLRPELMRRAAGSTFLEISKKSLGTVPFQLPPLPEQRKISAILSVVDDVIERTEAVIENLQTLKTSMMQELLTRGLPGRHTCFKQTEIGEIPEEWELSRMESLAISRGMVGGPFGSDLTASDYVPPPGVPVIRGANVSMGAFSDDDLVYVSVKKAESLEKNHAVRGDIIMTQRGASLGEATIIPPGSAHPRYVISQTMMRMTADDAKVSPRFLLHFMCSPAGQSWLRNHQIGTGQPHLNLGIFRAMPAIVPPRDEQDAIVQTIDSVDRTIEANRGELAVLTQCKRGLVPILLTGELRVVPDEDSA